MESRSTDNRPDGSAPANPGGSSPAPPAGDEFYRDALMQLVNERSEANEILDRIASALEAIAAVTRAGSRHYGVPDE